VPGRWNEAAELPVKGAPEMSLILDALRKMEQDRNSRRGSAQDLRPEVLRYRRAPGPQRSLPVLPIVAGAVLVACGIGAGFLVRGHRSVILADQATSAPAALVEQAPASNPTPVAAAPAPALAAPVAPAAPELPRAPVAVAAPAKPEPSAAPNQPQVTAKIPSKTVRPTKPARREVEPAQAVQQPIAASSGDIALSGIAWQDERNMRRAVLNGSLVGEGALVAGARVVEIREDRVRFSRNGQLFEAVLSGSR